MSPVGLIGIFLSLLAWPVACARPTSNRLYLFVTLLALHLAASFAYYLYVQSAPADTATYYYDFIGIDRWPFALGTVLVVKLVQMLKGTIGGTYFDYFLIFQAAGFWGIVLLMRTLEEVHIKLSVPQTTLSFVVLFLPGVHFWTSAIGKDAPLFLGCSLAVWAAMRLPARLPYFVLAVVIMALFRPHIALIAVGALAISEFFDPKTSPIRKILLLGIALAGVGVVGSTIQTTFNVDVTSADSVSGFFERQQAVAQGIGGSTAVTDASYPVKLLSLLFRPLFFDGTGPYAMVASMENLFYLFIVGFLVVNVRLVIRLATRVLFVRFCLIFATTLILLLAMVYYNVGLGARQKTMVVPALFSLLGAVMAVRYYRLDQLPAGDPAVEQPAALRALGHQKHA